METVIDKKPAPFVLPLADARDSAMVGGKAINLARLINAAFPVPNGFVVTTTAFRHANRSAEAIPPDVADAITAAYRNIGSPTVAVRSSATAEDLDDASMAGQYETYLDLQGDQAVLDAVVKCWGSIESERVCAYLKEHDIPHEHVAMAVVVQELVPAEKAGVLFTANPRTGSKHELLVEANWGLGETVVSGMVQPDMLVLDRATGAVESQVISDKHVWIEPGAHETRPLPQDKRRIACLNSTEVVELWKLGLQVMDHFDSPQDIEWAIAGGKMYLLQTRSVTTLEDAETYEQLLSDVRTQLRAAHKAGRGDWVRHNIGETLPHPTPLTWSVIRRFMSGGGGFGAMYKRVGFEPSATICEDGFLDLVGGRIYMDLSRAPEMFFEAFPYTYDLDLLRSNPDAAQGPPTVPSGSFLAQLGVARRLKVVNRNLRALARRFDRRLTDEIIPQFQRYVLDEKTVDLAALSTSQWLKLWQDREREVLDRFAPDSLLPSLVAAMALDDLKCFISEHFWDEDPDALASQLSPGGEEDLTVASSQHLHDIAEGQSSVEQWLAEYGHRAPDEFDLGAPRWRETPELVARLAEHMKDTISPLERHRTRADDITRRVAQMTESLPPARRDEFAERLALVHRYIRFREDAKHYLMLGYDLLRDMLLDAGQRLDIGDGASLLEIEELHDALVSGVAPLHLIEKRRELRMAEKRLALPDVITEADLASLGEAPVITGGDRLDAFVLSGGTCSGPARIVHSPQDAGDLGSGYVLVCPSTDPSWTPLFVGACGVVLERGGTLSHGAVVAREMGLPAVVLSDATRLIEEDEEITVDGQQGAVLRHSASQTAPPAAPGPDDTRIAPDKTPPVPGRTERRGALIRNAFLLLWTVFFLIYFLVPPALEDASYRILDAALLPLAAAAGKPVVVALLAALFALLTMVGQKLLTDNERLREAKKRAAALQKEARGLPKDSPRFKALGSPAGPVQVRVMKAAFVPLAIFLGPMIVSFLWLPQRVDTAVRNAKPGSAVKVTAVVNGDCDKAVALSAAKPLALDEISKPEQRIFLARGPLEQHLRKLRDTQSDLGDMAWDKALTVKRDRKAYLGELEAFLAGNMPDQKLSWAVTTPQGTGGKWPVTLSVAGGQTVTVHAVLGEGYAPETKEDLVVKTGKRVRTDRQVQVWRTGADNAVIKEVHICYRDPNPVKGEGTFWGPLDWFEADENTGPFKAMFSPWLVLYIAVYVVVMFAVKLILRVA
jgi:pyruvate,water dikinase